MQVSDFCIGALHTLGKEELFPGPRWLRVCLLGGLCCLRPISQVGIYAVMLESRALPGLDMQSRERILHVDSKLCSDSPYPLELTGCS